MNFPTLLLIVPVTLWTGTAGAQDTSALLTKDNCATCHAVDQKKVGPSYMDIATKYRGNTTAEATVIGELTNAKGHPKVTASADDIKTLVEYILAMH